MVTLSVQRGFSLVEILIAMTLLSMITLLGSQAFSLLAKRWDGQVGNFDQQVYDLRIQLSVYDSLQKIIPYVVNDPEGVPKLYFEGNRNGFVGVTSQALINPNVAAVVRLSIVQNNDFLYDLIYEEAPMEKSPFYSLSQPIVFNPPIVLKRDIAQVEFSYYGDFPPQALSASDNIPNQDNESEDRASEVKWSQDYNSLVSQRQPRKIQVSLLKDNMTHSFVVDMIQPTPGLISRLAQIDQEQSIPMGY